MENQGKSKTVKQVVSEFIYLEKYRTEIEKTIQNQELRVSSLETNMELMITKNTIVQKIFNTVNGNEEEVNEQLRRMKEENERTSKELKVHESQIENNILNIEVQRYLIEKIKKKLKKKKNDCTINEEVIKELVKEEITKKYLQKIKDEIEKNKKENINPTDNNPIKEQTHNVPIISPKEISFDTKYIKQLKEWTNRKVGNILFDSDNDDWNKNTSIFEERIMNKEHIIIIIEGEDGNKFGGYVNSKIDEFGYVNDSQSFLFSLESKGRIEGMKKFDIKYPEDAFWLHNKSDYSLFGNGYDICVYKENNKIKSYCYQRSFEYKGISNALCGKSHPDHFTPKRIIVIEMK
ncbi:hypothetical protein ENUP19_0149G0031 [Entamoeba nuttalli]|uniref:TLDc domain-containing protein n=1 Tax=Entamoeba nuttalli TaxID=412467 RepID=A0ABQ0DKV0_9EUKA